MKHMFLNLMISQKNRIFQPVKRFCIVVLYFIEYTPANQKLVQIL